MEAVQSLLETAIAPQTRRTYVRAFRLLTQFVSSTFQIDNTLPVSVDTLTFFIAYLHRKQMAASTICTYVTAIGYINQLAGHQNPTQSFVIKKLLAAVKRGTHRPDSRQPVTPAILTKLVESLIYTSVSYYQRIMLKSMYLLAFHAFLRIGEITHNKCSTNIIQLRDIQFFQTSQARPARLELTFRSFKGNYNIRPIILSLVARVSEMDKCPVLSLYKFIELRGNSPGPLYCLPGNLVITYEHFRKCLSNSLVWAGLPPSQYKTHSFRIGAASTASALGIADEDIQHMGRWKSLAFKRYVRLPTMYAPVL